MSVENKKLKAGLYIVATPIGNLEDITIRALDTLKRVDLILCEDTRHSRTLLTHYGINKPLWSYNDHSTDKNRADIVQKIQEDKAVDLISDAGTPLISDPGYKLVSLSHEHNLFVTSCPGPCSVITALSLSGCPTDKFYFLGFLPLTQKDRSSLLTNLQHFPGSLIFFSTSNKILKDLEDVKDNLGDVEIVLQRELTKLFEQRIAMSVVLLIAQLTTNPVKGEIVVIIPPREIQHEDLEIKEIVEQLKSCNLSSKDIVKIISTINPNISKQRIYKESVDKG